MGLWKSLTAYSYTRLTCALTTRYFSYGASAEPSLWSVFRRSHQIIDREEGANDGLVSVGSSKWGTYKGTLVGVSHLDLINWTNRLRWFIWEMAGNKRESVVSSFDRIGRAFPDQRHAGSMQLRSISTSQVLFGGFAPPGPLELTPSGLDRYAGQRRPLRKDLSSSALSCLAV